MAPGDRPVILFNDHLVAATSVAVLRAAVASAVVRRFFVAEANSPVPVAAASSS